MSIATGGREVRVWETSPDEINVKDAVRDEGEIGASPVEVANVSKLAVPEIIVVEKAVQTLTPVVGQPEAYVGGDGKTYVASDTVPVAEVPRHAPEIELTDIVLRAPYANEEEVREIGARLEADHDAQRLAEEKTNRSKRRRRNTAIAGITLLITAALAA